MDGELGLKMGSVRTIILGNNMYAGKPNPLDTEVNKIKYFWNLFISYSSLPFLNIYNRDFNLIIFL